MPENNQEEKPKVLVLLGEDILRLVHYLPALEQEVMHRDPNRQVMNSNFGKIKLADISGDPCDIVSIYAHGNADVIQFQGGQKKHKTAYSGLMDGEDFTIQNLINIQSKKHNRHFDILGCYQGAVIQDIEHAMDSFEAGTTFTIHAPAQYSVSATRGNPLLLDQLRQYSLGERDQAKLFGRYCKKTVETLFFIKIVKGLEGKNTMIAFKAIAPKYARDAQALETFMDQEALYQFGSKAHQHANLVTITGADHPEYSSVHDAIVREKRATPLSADYLHQTLKLHEHRSRARKTNAMQGKYDRKHRSSKEPFVEALLKQYQDIPDAVAKSYDSILIIKDVSVNDNTWYQEHYAHVVEYAIDHNQTIGAKDPILWAIEENIKIGQTHPLLWAIEKDKMICAEPALQWALRTGYTIEGESALEFAMKRNKKIEGQSAIEWALEHDIKCSEQPVLEWAIDNKIKIGDLSALEYAVIHDKLIAGQPALDWLIEHYRTRLFSDDFTSKSYVLQYEEEGQFYTKEIPPFYPMADMAREAMHKEGTIDGLPVDEWIENYCRHFTHHRIFGHTPVEYALEQGRKIKGLDTIGIPELYNVNAIEAAIERNNLSELETALHIDPNARNNFNNTPLDYAISRNKPQSVRALLALGADPNLENAYRETALLKAARMGSIEILRVLLEGSGGQEFNSAYGTKLLSEARSAEVVDLLLQYGVEPNRPYSNGMIPLQHAIFMGDLPLIHALLKGGAKPDDPDNAGIVLLHQAICSNKQDLVEALLQANADPHEAKPYTPYDEMYGNIEFPACLAAQYGNSEIISLLADKGVDLNICGVNGKTPLSLALARMNRSYAQKELQEIFDVIKTLLARGADPKILNSDGSSPLSILQFAHGSINNIQIKNAILDLLLAAGVDVNVANENKVSLLQSAVAKGDIMLVEKLCAHQVDPNRQDKAGNSPLSVALSMYKNPPQFSYSPSLENANRDVRRMIKSLLHQGANPNIQDKMGASALQIFASFNDPKIMNMLLEAKANPNIQDNEGNSPLSCLVDRVIERSRSYDHFEFERELTRLKAFLEYPAVDPNILRKQGNSEIEYVLENTRGNNRKRLLQTLIEAPQTDANLLNTKGIRLLSVVIETRDHECVNLVLQKADVNLPDADGTTPLQHAIRRNDPELVGFLLESGANVTAPGKGGILPITEAVGRLSVSSGIFERPDNYEIIKMLLEKGADPNRNPSLLQDALKCQDEKLVVMLSSTLASSEAERPKIKR